MSTTEANARSVLAFDASANRIRDVIRKTVAETDSPDMARAAVDGALCAAADAWIAARVDAGQDRAGAVAALLDYVRGLAARFDPNKLS